MTTVPSPNAMMATYIPGMQPSLASNWKFPVEPLAGKDPCYTCTRLSLSVTVFPQKLKFWHCGIAGGRRGRGEKERQRGTRRGRVGRRACGRTTKEVTE